MNRNLSASSPPLCDTLEVADPGSTEIHVFVLWPNAKQHLSQFLSVLSSRFGEVAEFEIEWSRNFAHRNLQRLYGSDEDMGDRLARIGLGTFTVAVIKDVRAKHVLDITPSGNLEKINEKVTETKAFLRALTETPEFKYLVHSSNSKSEANKDLFLLLGSQWRDKLHEGKWPTGKVRIKRDLAGNERWETCEEFISFLNNAFDYVALRPDVRRDNLRGSGGDFDLLTIKSSDLAIAVNAVPNRSDGKGNHYSVNVQGTTLMLDIRQVGDTDCDRNWQAEMLRSKKMRDGVFVPEDEQLFFYLIHHAFLHSAGKLTRTRIGELQTLSKGVLSRDLSKFVRAQGGLTNSRVSAWLLKGYLKSHSYDANKSRILSATEDSDFRAFLESDRGLNLEYLSWKRASNADVVADSSPKLNPVP